MRNMREIWRHNLEHEFSIISQIVFSDFCNYITIDTEFPGFIHRTPVGASSLDRYRDLKLNVDSMKIIQLGFMLHNEQGMSYSLAWQVNFKEFNPAVDTRVTSSIQLLRNSGIDFERNMREGVDAEVFATRLWWNLIYPCHGRTKWISFHGLYDFAYLVRLLLQRPLPNTLPEFLGTVRCLFGNVYDVKHIARFYGFDERTGLMSLAERLGIHWEGRHHQAGFDSMLIGEVFWKLKERFGLNEDSFVGIIHGAEMFNKVPFPVCTHFVPHGFCPRPIGAP